MKQFPYRKDPARIPIKEIRCPLCKRLNNLLRLNEVWTAHAIEFSCTGAARDPEGELMADGRPMFVEAKCTCGHEWKLRGVTQITDIDL